MMKAVTGRSFSTTVIADTGVTASSHGEASSCRRNRVYDWMSTVRPSRMKASGGGATATESTPDVSAGAAGAVVTPAAAAGVRLPTRVSQVYAGSARATSSMTCGQI